ncbi:AAA family ATPase [Rossellomorea sp. H39__3]
MSGFPGSGKSTLAREIGKRTGAVIVDHDVTKSALMEKVGNGLTHDMAGKCRITWTGPSSESLLAQGHSVIFDSPCLYDEMVEKGTLLAEKYGIPYKYIECVVHDFTLINERLRERDRMPSQIKEVKSEEAFLKTVLNSKKPNCLPCLQIDTSSPITSYITRVIQYLENGEGGAE